MSFRSWLQRNALPAFFVLAFALSWAAWIPRIANPDFPFTIFAFGPFLAALIVAGATGGRVAVQSLLSRMVRWRVRWGWYVVALFLPAALMVLAVVLNVMLGATAPEVSKLRSVPSLVVTFLIALLIPGFGGAWEEPGWRGYALPRLQYRRTALAASLILGVVVAGWHLPLFLAREMGWAGLVSTVVATVVIVWVFNNTQGSVLMAMLFHASNNTVNRLFNPLFSGADSVRLEWLFAGLYLLAAVAVVGLAGPARLSHRPLPESVREP